MVIDYKLLDDLKIDGIDYSDAPDFCDAFISSGLIKENGVYRDLNDEELDTLNNDGDLVRKVLEEHLY